MTCAYRFVTIVACAWPVSPCTALISPPLSFKKLYEKVGFYEVNVVEEDDYKEVNMIYAVDAEVAEDLKKSWLTDD